MAISGYWFILPPFCILHEASDLQAAKGAPSIVPCKEALYFAGVATLLLESRIQQEWMHWPWLNVEKAHWLNPPPDGKRRHSSSSAAPCVMKRWWFNLLQMSLSVPCSRPSWKHTYSTLLSNHLWDSIVLEAVPITQQLLSSLKHFPL